MKTYKIHPVPIWLAVHILVSSMAWAQTADTGSVIRYVEEHAGDLGLIPDDVTDLRVSDAYVDRRSGITFVYLQQQVEGIGVHNALLNAMVARDGQVSVTGNRFISGLHDRVVTSGVGLSSQGAVEAAARHHGLDIATPLNVVESSSGPDRRSLLGGDGWTLEDIPARLVYQALENGEVRLAWDVGLYTLDAQHYWSARVDASTGELLDEVDLVVHELPRGDAVASRSDSIHDSGHAAGAATRTGQSPDSYFVIPLPAESPHHPAGWGTPQSTETNPADATASPWGWHDTNGIAGADFDDTRGNNVDAYQDADNTGSPSRPRPDGGAALDFNVTFDFGTDPATGSNPDASVINLYYWANIIHDVLYQYGFDELAGNFQVNNYGRGGVGGDNLRAESQDGGGNCNANLFTPADGSRPRYQAYLCDNAAPRRDGSFDNGALVHEYTHGLSNRLTGGPAATGCLSNSEQAGEGWSDWYHLMFTRQVGDTGPKPRSVGTYLFGQGPDDPGIRVRQYSTDFAVNELTYDNIKTLSIPHGLGVVWGTMLWDLTWALIGGDPNFPDIPAGDDGAGGGSGFDPDLYRGTGGNNLALQLVTTALKLQPCSPGFVDGRDAILAADIALTGGLNSCTIWQVFARRGLGFSADQGSSFNRSDGTEAFDMPPNELSGCPTYMLQAKALLEGAYNGIGGMTTELNSELPLAQPFSGSPWTYAGGEAVNSMHPDVVDWLLAEIRTDTSGATTAERQAVLLLNDGSIVDTSGTALPEFQPPGMDSVFVVLRHRNHLDVMSKDKVDLSDVSTIVDFTTAGSAFGINPQVNLEGPLYGLYSGDANGDGRVQAVDFDAYLTQTVSGASGYQSADFNMDGSVQASDFDRYIANTLLGVSSQVP